MEVTNATWCGGPERRLCSLACIDDKHNFACEGPAPGEQACRSGSLSTQVLPENNFATEKVRVRRGGPDWSARGWLVLPAEVRRRTSACRGGSCSPWRFDGGHEGWRVLLAEVVTDHREGRRSSSSRSFVLPRRFVFAVEVRLAAEVVADEREGLARRGGSSCCGGCYRRLRGSGSSRSFSLPRRFVFAVEVRLAPEVVADDREGPA